jgi:class 3 adenylate cyclase
MPELPSGTLTVLHTDIENSTLLTVHLGDRYPEVLATHCALLRAAFVAHEGHEVDTQGDSFFVVFPRATQAVAAAVAIQCALAAAAWPEGGAVRVRIGMHTGEPIRAAQGYTGLDVIRGARIKEAGHGGQVLLSKATAALVEDALIDDLSLRDLGAHRLKGLPRPERIFQLLIPDLPADFPPLRSLDTHWRTRLDLAPGRVLTTVLFVDLVGATERAVALGDRRWLALQAQYIVLVRQELARHGGEEINLAGDGFLAVFDGAAAAIRCGCTIRDAVQELGMAVRVGIHAGEVESDDRTMSGITVFTGSRITRVAQPSEVLVSNTVKELVAGSGITFTDRGTHLLRGLPGEWRLFTPDVPEASAPTS